MPGRIPPSARVVALAVATLLLLPAGAPARDRDGCLAGGPVQAELNRVRAEAGVAPVRRRPALARAACAYAGDMVARRFFSHTSPEGDGPADRARGAGYLRHFPSWRVGEILQWARAPVFRPADAAARWLASPAHRAILLSPAYRDVGVGVAPGAPTGDASPTPAVTIAVLFGDRSRARR